MSFDSLAYAAGHVVDCVPILLLVYLGTVLSW